MKKYPLILILVILVLIFSFSLINKSEKIVSPQTDQPEQMEEGELEQQLNPLSIELLRNGTYPGSDILIEETLTSGSNYKRYITSYKSEGLKIYGLLTIPNGEKPQNGWPAIIFNHGYIPPLEYKTTERYIAYTDGFSRNGYVLFKPDYRGHGSSEGEPRGAYGSNGYTIDVLNAFSSIKKFKDVNPNNIGMWGHSLGGYITLRSMVVQKEIKVGVIWAGVVASYPDLLYNWRRSTFIPPPGIPSGARRWRDELIAKYGTPEQNSKFWDSISANSFLKDLSGPIALHHATGDESVPVAFSQKLDKEIKQAGKITELYVYQGDDHNISNNFNTAMQRSLEFFDKYLKN